MRETLFVISRSGGDQDRHLVGAFFGGVAGGLLIGLLLIVPLDDFYPWIFLTLVACILTSISNESYRRAPFSNFINGYLLGLVASLGLVVLWSLLAMMWSYREVILTVAVLAFAIVRLKNFFGLPRS